jgi:anaerobic C4-dicarboxylate transporter DcuA
MIYIQLLVVIAAIVMGVRMGGIGMGVMGGIGLFILTFVLGLKPGSAPIDVILIIICVITASSTLQAAKGLDYMVQVAENILRKNPKQIVFLAPVIAWLFTAFAGTGFIALALMPIVAEISEKTGIRPERAMSGLTVASQMAIVACPVSASTVALAALLEPQGISLTDILMISIPSTLIAAILGAVVMLKYGKELDQDPVYLERLKNGEIQAHDPSLEGFRKELPKGAVYSVIAFLLAIVFIVIMAMNPEWRTFDGKVESMVSVIQITMLAVSGINILAFGSTMHDIFNGDMFKSGLVAAVSILGIAWMSDTFIQANMEVFKGGIISMVETQPWTFALAVFAMAVLLFSQGATTKVMMPIGISLGIPALSLIAMYPAVVGVYFLPSYPSSLAAVGFDRTGTTHIGKYVLNHSFMLSGLVNTVVSIIVGFILVSILF